MKLYVGSEKLRRFWRKWNTVRRTLGFFNWISLFFKTLSINIPKSVIEGRRSQSYGAKTRLHSPNPSSSLYKGALGRRARKRWRCRVQGYEVVLAVEGLKDGASIDWWNDDGLRGGFQGTASSRKRLDDSRASAWLGLPRVCLTQFHLCTTHAATPRLAGVVFAWAGRATARPVYKRGGSQGRGWTDRRVATWPIPVRTSPWRQRGCMTYRPLLSFLRRRKLVRAVSA